MVPLSEKGVGGSLAISVIFTIAFPFLKETVLLLLHVTYKVSGRVRTPPPLKKTLLSIS